MKTTLKIAVVSAMLILTGCAADKMDRPPHQGMFVTEGEERRVQQAVRMQAATGALEDATLYAWHFDGKDLSPLGRQKLDSIVDADTLATVNVYLDVKSDTYGDRSKSVNAYLADKGLAVAHVKVTEGYNTEVSSSAQLGLLNYNKTDTGNNMDSVGEATMGKVGTSGAANK